MMMLCGELNVDKKRAAAKRAAARRILTRERRSSPLANTMRKRREPKIPMSQRNPGKLVLQRETDKFVDAAAAGDAEEMMRRLSHGQDVNGYHAFLKKTALMCACTFGRAKVAKVLPEHGADANLRTAVRRRTTKQRSTWPPPTGGWKRCGCSTPKTHWSSRWPTASSKSAASSATRRRKLSPFSWLTSARVTSPSAGPPP